MNIKEKGAVQPRAIVFRLHHQCILSLSVESTHAMKRFNNGKSDSQDAEVALMCGSNIKERRVGAIDEDADPPKTRTLSLIIMERRILAQLPKAGNNLECYPNLPQLQPQIFLQPLQGTP